ncbi:MAG: peptide-methionine (R)-S-oxide reductase MsrB [Chryseolinea sp.]
MNKIKLTLTFIVLAFVASHAQTDINATASASKYEVAKSADEWRKALTPMQYHVLREKGTERAFSGALWDNHEKGTYYCAACNLPIFDSSTKFESGTGWPSFYKPLNESAVKIIKDTTYNMVREEVVCSRCGGHLGHVFEDGPKPTGLRYCMNSVSFTFDKKK